MTTPVNIAANASQPVPAASANGTNKGQPAEAGNLFAALLGLSGGAEPSGDPAATGIPGQQASAASPLFDLAALLGTAGNDGKPGQTPEELDKALSDLLDKLKKLADPSSGQPLPVPAQLAQLGDLAKSVSGLLDQLTASGNVPSADALSGLADKLQKLADQLTATPDTAPGLAKPANAASPLPQLAKATPLPDDALAALQKLGGQIDELAQKVEHLAQKAQEPTASGTAIAKPAAAADPEIANMVSMLYGDRQAGQRPDADKPAAKQEGLKLSATAASQTATQPSAPAGVAPAEMLAQQQKTDPQDTTKKPELTLAAAGATGAPAKTAEGAPDAKPDPLLVGQPAPGASQKADFAAALKPATAPYQQPSPQINVPQLAFEMASQVKAGNSRFQIRLDPPEMGRIDVKMDIDHTGHLHAKLTVERADTLDLLQRDARGLERALQQAGLDHSRTNLEFSLKQNPFARQDQHQGGQPHTPFALAQAEDDSAAAEPAEIPAIGAARFYRGTASPGGLNLLA